MAPATQKKRKPAITVTRSDHERLSGLADSISTRNPAVADQLASELDRARVVDDRRISADVVRMGSRLRFTTDAGEDRTVTLVFPGDANIAEGKISVLTPIGAALIGLSAGQFNLRELFGAAKALLFDQDRPILADFTSEVPGQHFCALCPQTSAALLDNAALQLRHARCRGPWPR
jgi:regulator of nucleoside diphosphate kinase